MITKKQKKKENTPVDFKSRTSNIDTNIGLVVFIVALIYLIGSCFSYITEHNISTYKVSYGSIINDTAYSALAIREENIYNAEASGYIQYYYSEGSKMGYNSIIYTISASDTSTVNTTSSDSYTLSSSDQDAIVSSIQSFNHLYDSSEFYKTYDLINDIEKILETSGNDEKLSELSSLNTATSNLEIFRATDDGILMYYTDGYEGITLDNFTSYSFDTDSYVQTTISSGDNVTTQSSAYKLLTDEEWSMVIEIAEEELTLYRTMSTVTLKFTSDNEIITANFELMEDGDTAYGIITMKTGMVRYANDRFIDIELIFDDLEGYKIPITSVTTRSFYKVPLDYVTQGGEYGSDGLMIMGTDGFDSFQAIDVYYKDTEYVYLDVDDIGLNQTIIQEDTAELLLLSDVVEMDGVYSVNKGYAEFKIVDILTSSSEYYIVSDSTSYSISNYDYIALEADSLYENAIIN